MASFVQGFSPAIPVPVNPSVFYLLEVKSAFQHHAGKLLVFCAPCLQHHLLHPAYPLSCCVSGSPSPHPGDSRSQEFPAHPFLRPLQCNSGVSPLVSGISPPLPQDYAPALSGPAMTLLQPYLAQPYLCIVGCHTWGQELQPLALLPSRSLTQSKPTLGVTAASFPQQASHESFTGRGATARRIFLGFFPPHFNAQDGRITTVR